MGSTTIELVSIYQASAYLQATPHQIRAAAEASGITVAARVNGVDMYWESDIERLRTQIAAVRFCAGMWPLNELLAGM